MVRLEDPILMRPELFQFRFEELVLLVCYCLLVENENVGYIIRVNLYSY